jgi:hypothetical protein
MPGRYGAPSAVHISPASGPSTSLMFFGSHIERQPLGRPDRRGQPPATRRRGDGWPAGRDRHGVTTDRADLLLCRLCGPSVSGEVRRSRERGRNILAHLLRDGLERDAQAVRAIAADCSGEIIGRLRQAIDDVHDLAAASRSASIRPAADQIAAILGEPHLGALGLDPCAFFLRGLKRLSPGDAPAPAPAGNRRHSSSAGDGRGACARIAFPNFSRR